MGNSLPFYPKMLSWSIKIDHDEITVFRIGIFFFCSFFETIIGRGLIAFLGLRFSLDARSGSRA